jgi:DegV family protein with EDD domain
MQAIAGARAIASGAGIPGIVAAMQAVQSSTYALLTVETLKYLAKSGRVSNLRAGVGDLLGVKPILTLEDGLLIHASQARGRKRSKREILDKMVTHFGEAPVVLAVAHSNVLAEAEDFLTELGTVITIEESHVVGVGPAIASLAGAGVLAVLAHPVIDPTTVTAAESH